MYSKYILAWILRKPPYNNKTHILICDSLYFNHRKRPSSRNILGFSCQGEVYMCVCLNNTSVKKKKKEWINSTKSCDRKTNLVAPRSQLTTWLLLCTGTVCTTSFCSSTEVQWARFSAGPTMCTHASAHTGRDPVTVSPISTLLTSGRTQRPRAECRSELRSPEGSGLANVLQWRFLVGKKSFRAAWVSSQHGGWFPPKQKKRWGT